MNCSPASLQGSKADDVFVIDENQNRKALLRTLKYYDLQERKKGIEPSWIAINRNIGARLQDGPSCGLVGLRMAVESLGFTCTQSMNEILDVAKSLKYTNKGEMFLASNLASLGERLFPEFEFTVQQFPSSRECIDLILDGCVLLVPYDCAGNHTPGLFKGSKAHWTVIKGFISSITEEGKDCISENIVEFNEDSWKVYFHDLVNNILVPDSIKKFSFDETNLLVIGQQGKSKNQSVWTFKELRESNLNLVDAVNGRYTDLLLPPNLDGLRDKIIIIKKKESNNL